MSEKESILLRQCNEQLNICISFCHYNEKDKCLVNYLCDREKENYTRLNARIKKEEYLIGRYTAKYAVKGLAPHLDMADIHVNSGIFHEPLIITDQNVPFFVSISHKANMAVALVSTLTGSIGIDLELANTKYNEAIELVCTDKEKYKHCSKGLHMVLWTAKEAVSKVFKTGLKADFKMFEVDEINRDGNILWGSFTYFPQFCFKCLLLNDVIISVVLPVFLHTVFDIENLNQSMKQYGY